MGEKIQFLKTYPTFLRFEGTKSESLTNFTFPNEISPLIGFSKPAIRLRKLVFPSPFPPLSNKFFQNLTLNLHQKNNFLS